MPCRSGISSAMAGVRYVTVPAKPTAAPNRNDWNAPDMTDLPLVVGFMTATCASRSSDRLRVPVDPIVGWPAKHGDADPQGRYQHDQIRKEMAEASVRTEWFGRLVHFFAIRKDAGLSELV